MRAAQHAGLQAAAKRLDEVCQPVRRHGAHPLAPTHSHTRRNMSQKTCYDGKTRVDHLYSTKNQNKASTSAYHGLGLVGLTPVHCAQLKVYLNVSSGLGS